MKMKKKNNLKSKALNIVRVLTCDSINTCNDKLHLDLVW